MLIMAQKNEPRMSNLILLRFLKEFSLSEPIVKIIYILNKFFKCLCKLSCRWANDGSYSLIKSSNNVSVKFVL